MIRTGRVWWLAACLMLAGPALAGEAAECVVLLHGLGRTAGSMEPVARALDEAGYATVNLDYPSRKQSIDALAMSVVPQGVQRCERRGAERIHFVTHSMGGILLRYYLTQRPLPALGRVVMLSPPNHGSEVADRLRDDAFYRWFNGPAGQQLGTGEAGLPSRLGPVDYPVGVITGNVSAFWDAWFAADWIPGPDDGKVSVESAKLEGMRDFLVVPHSHTFIMRQPAVIDQVRHFLRHGCFRHPDVAVESCRRDTDGSPPSHRAVSPP